MKIQASYASLTLAFIGFVLQAYGVYWCILHSFHGTSRAGFASLSIGAILLVIALILHVDHLSYRIGRPAVVLLILTGIIYGLCLLPFVLKPSLSIQHAWSNYSGAIWASTFVGMGLALAAIAVHKERQIEKGLTQVADVGATDAADVTVHASFLSLTLGSTGAFLYAFGAFETVGHFPAGRATCVAEVLGFSLLALAIITHVVHLKRHIGTAAVTFAILGPILMSIAFLSTAVNPANAKVPSWHHFGAYATGGGRACFAIAIGLIIARKASLESKSAG